MMMDFVSAPFQGFSNFRFRQRFIFPEERIFLEDIQHGLLESPPAHKSRTGLLQIREEEVLTKTAPGYVETMGICDNNETTQRIQLFRFMLKNSKVCGVSIEKSSIEIFSLSKKAKLESAIVSKEG
jgi:hypothetical protein